MRLLYQSHVYLLASFMLHAGILLALVFGSIRFGKQLTSFEATIEFVTPPSPQKIDSTGTFKHKAGKRSSSDSIRHGTPQLSSKNLDDILKTRGLKVDAKDNVDSAIDKKRSDLLGYLRANKLTKEATPQSQISKAKKNRSVETNQSVQSTSDQPAAPQSTQTTNPAQSPPVTSTLKDQGINPKEDQVIPPARRIWQKKKEDHSYKQTLKELVTANWTVPIYNKKDFQILIEAIIDQHGNLLKIELLKGSGLPIIDAAAEKAIRVSTPFPKLPKILREEKSEFTAIFRFTPDNVVR